jgi:hypothetical protein
MKFACTILLAGALTLTFTPLAGAASLLGGLITTGEDSGNAGGLVSNNDNGSLGLLGEGGVAVNLPSGDGSPVGNLLGGGGDNPVGDLLGGTGDVGLGGGSAGVEGLATIDTNSDSGGTNLGITLLGGGGDEITSNPGGLLGGDGGINIGLPDLGGLVPGDNGGSGGGSGGDGGNGGNGGSGGGNGNGGGSGGNGGNGGGGGSGGGDGGSGGGGGGTGGIVINYYGSTNSGVLPGGVSSRLKALLRILAERDYLRLSNGRAVCLNAFGTAEVAGWIPQKDWGALQQALANYSQDIYALRQLLGNCRSATQRQALNLTNLNRVIGLDIGKDGRPVLFML